MKKTAIVYWSGTGNTEAMAECVAQGVRAAGGEAELFTPDVFSPEKIDEFDAFAFGCSAQGDEVLEESEFEPMFAACEGKLAGKPVALFGSYGWGDGAWMRAWEARCAEAGVRLVCESVILCEAPDASGEEQCRALGEELAK